MVLQALPALEHGTIAHLLVKQQRKVYFVSACHGVCGQSDLTFSQDAEARG